MTTKPKRKKRANPLDRMRRAVTALNLAIVDAAAAGTPIRMYEEVDANGESWRVYRLVRSVVSGTYVDVQAEQGGALIARLWSGRPAMETRRGEVVEETSTATAEDVEDCDDGEDCDG